jgi:hydroxymethylpyrimidine/phosphomethylpyrimidine kinase
VAIPTALTIAGSDSGGGAGIQADLKTFQELSVYGTSVITVLTAQNTLGVQGVFPQSLDVIEAQLDSVLSDIGANAVKTGMLYSAEIISLVAKKLKFYGVQNIVVDPVMYAKGGAALLQREAMDALKSELLPLATVITPNIPEACELLGVERLGMSDIPESAGRQLLELGPRYVLLKGGHLEGRQSIDWLVGQELPKPVAFESARIATKHTHGTGCTLSAAIAAELAKGQPVQESIAAAKRFITAAIASGLQIGGGIGPTDHGAYRRLYSLA